MTYYKQDITLWNDAEEGVTLSAVERSEAMHYSGLGGETPYQAPDELHRGYYGVRDEMSPGWAGSAADLAQLESGEEWWHSVGDSLQDFGGFIDRGADWVVADFYDSAAAIDRLDASMQDWIARGYPMPMAAGSSWASFSALPESNVFHQQADAVNHFSSAVEPVNPFADDVQAEEGVWDDDQTWR